MQLDAQASNFNPIPNIAVTESNLKIIKSYSGSQINDYVKRTTNGLSLINDSQTAGEVAVQLVASGIVGFGTVMIFNMIRALRAGSQLRAAVTVGIRAAGGVTVIVSVVAALIVELLVYLLVTNQKVFLGMVFNNTDINLVVKDWRNGVDGGDSGDLFMNTGSMKSFMETNENEMLDSSLIQLMARSFIAPNDPDNIVMGGIFHGEKNIGLYGTDGAMVFSDAANNLPRFSLLFSCPYTRDNGVNVAIDTTSKQSAKTYFDKLFDGRGLDKSVSQGNYTFQARCASSSGGDATGIAVLEALTP